MALIDFSLGDVGALFGHIREAITGERIEDPNKKTEMLAKLDMLEQELTLGQLRINEQEARHESVFVAGWRPFIGWVGGSALAYNYILQPVLIVILSSSGVDIKAPELDIGNLMLLITGLLGFGGFRTYEKVKRVNGRGA